MLEQAASSEPPGASKVATLDPGSGGALDCWAAGAALPRSILNYLHFISLPQRKVSLAAAEVNIIDTKNYANYEKCVGNCCK